MQVKQGVINARETHESLLSRLDHSMLEHGVRVDRRTCLP